MWFLVSGSSVYIHQVSKLRSQVLTTKHTCSMAHSFNVFQVPFRKLKGQVQRVLFHPHKPLFFIAVRFVVISIPSLTIPFDMCEGNI